MAVMSFFWQLELVNGGYIATCSYDGWMNLVEVPSYYYFFHMIGCQIKVTLCITWLGKSLQVDSFVHADLILVMEYVPQIAWTNLVLFCVGIRSLLKGRLFIVNAGYG